MNLNAELWIAMAAAALFYHFARTRKAAAPIFVLVSVAVSTLIMLTNWHGYVGILIGQAVLFVVLIAYLKWRK